MLDRKRYLVTYDIAEDKRRDHVHRTLTNYGDWLQYSVFRCDLHPRDVVALRKDLTALIHHVEDQVLLIDLGPAKGGGAERITSVGRPFVASPPTRIV